MAVAGAGLTGAGVRNIAMLANEAADAVNYGVCDVNRAYIAMRLRVIYPCSPLAWADAVGLPKNKPDVHQPRSSLR